MTENRIAREIVDVAYRIHVALGPGLLESVYEVVMARELVKRGLRVEAQVDVPVVFEGARFDIGFRADLIVEDTVIVEIKSVAEVAVVHKMQVRTYLRLTNRKLGLLINFNVPVIKDGISRVVNGLEEASRQEEGE